MTADASSAVKSVLGKILKETHDMVTIIVYAWRDGIPQAFLAPDQMQAEFLAVSSAAALGSLDAIGDIFGSKVKRVDVELENGEHIIISAVDGAFIALSTIPRPNLGLVHLVLRKYEDEIVKAAGVGYAGPQRVLKDSSERTVR
uniref:Roadblock/LAMTOR2 domain-containing protein n=1 Tax=Thermofilum pendens TaxID=2269 RepID=A0A7C3WU97_THEPE